MPTVRTPNSTIEQDDALKAYASVLDEIRVRLLGLNTIVIGTRALPEWITAELCYVQLRMVCELVAVGCLLAHGDLTGSRSKALRKEYAADEILKRLEGLHPNFFPRSIDPTYSPGHVHIEHVIDAMQKRDLINLYRECGGHLHRGSLDSIYRIQKPKQPPSIEQALAWGQRILGLLSQHHIATYTNKTHFLAFLSHHQAGGNAYVVMAKSADFEQ